MANAWINYVKTDLIHEGKATKTDKDGNQVEKTFYNISFPCADSKTGYASVSVSAGQVRDAVKKNGELKDGYKNILLGDADKVRQVSIVTKKAGKKTAAQYGKKDMTNAEIAEAFTSAREAYAASKATVAADAE